MFFLKHGISVIELLFIYLFFYLLFYLFIYFDKVDIRYFWWYFIRNRGCFNVFFNAELNGSVDQLGTTIIPEDLPILIFCKHLLMQLKGGNKMLGLPN